jgi:hypothetical protein
MKTIIAMSVGLALLSSPPALRAGDYKSVTPVVGGQVFTVREFVRWHFGVPDTRGIPGQLFIHTYQAVESPLGEGGYYFHRPEDSFHTLYKVNPEEARYYLGRPYYVRMLPIGEPPPYSK